MGKLNVVMQSVMKLLPPEAQARLLPQLDISEEIDASPAGAILMGVYVLEYVGFPRYVDELLGEKYRSIEELKEYYRKRKPEERPLTPSTGIILSLVVADMIACPRYVTRAYKFQEMAEKWQTGPLLGIEPSLLNDDRILWAMSALGAESQTMQEVLYKLVMDASEKADIPLNKFILDTTLLQLSGEFENAPKVVPGRGKIEPPLTAFETTWTLKEKIKPDLEPGQKRRPNGSIQTVEIEVRCVFYRHQGNAENEKGRREAGKAGLEEELKDFNSKLNKRKYQEVEYCQSKLDELLKAHPSTGKFMECKFSMAENGAISMEWSWDEGALIKEEKYDGIFALLTNYSKEQVNSNQLVTKYRSRDQIEMDFKDMKGILDMGKIIYQIPERIDAYIFLKVVAYFVLAFLRSYAVREGVKTTGKRLQESMGDMLLVEEEILPFGVKTYAVAIPISGLPLLFR